MAKIIFPFSDEDFTDIKRKESKFQDFDWTPREFLIYFGEFLRYHDKKYLTKSALKVINPEGRNLYVIDDVRYQDEADTIKEMGGIVLRINRYQEENPYGKNLDIISETDLDNYPFGAIIHEFNNTSLNKLYSQLDLIMDDLGIEK